MHIKKIRVDICIATYKRVDWLKKLLESLVAQALDKSISIRIIIIDNDPDQSARDMVVNFFSETSIAYVYDVQPEKNISLTRNKALDYVEADYLAFNDDDEWADGNWLQQLLLASEKYDADVVFGPVIPQFPSHTPTWIIKGGFFHRNINKTGEPMQSGGAGNVLIRHPNEMMAKLRFRPEFGKTGGEDTDLFHRLYSDGIIFVWCAEAIAYEVVPSERMTIKWLMMRALRSGQNFALITLERLSLLGKLIWFFQRLVYLLSCSIIFPASLVMGKAKWVWLLRKIMTNGGQLSVLFTDKIYQEYK